MTGPRRDILLDSDGNRVLIVGDYGFAEDVQAVKQGCEVRLKLLKGEVWLDQQKGVDYLGRVLVRNPNPIVIKAELGGAIADTPDVTDVVAASFAVDSQTRKGVASYTANTTLGQISGAAAAP